MGIGKRARRWTSRAVIAASGVCGALWASHPALAVDSTVTFSGTVTGACVMTVATVGAIASNGSLTEMSSTFTGGTSAVVTAVVTAPGLDVQVIAPTAFAVMPGGAPATSFVTSLEGTGDTTIPATGPSTPVGLNAGTTALTVDLTATSVGPVFPTGAYSADVIVRCE